MRTKGTVIIQSVVVSILPCKVPARRFLSNRCFSHFIGIGSWSAVQMIMTAGIFISTYPTPEPFINFQWILENSLLSKFWRFISGMVKNSRNPCSSCQNPSLFLLAKDFLPIILFECKKTVLESHILTNVWKKKSLWFEVGCFHYIYHQHSKKRGQMASLISFDSQIRQL